MHYTLRSPSSRHWGKTSFSLLPSPLVWHPSCYTGSPVLFCTPPFSASLSLSLLFPFLSISDTYMLTVLSFSLLSIYCHTLSLHPPPPPPPASLPLHPPRLPLSASLPWSVCSGGVAVCHTELAGVNKPKASRWEPHMMKNTVTCQ